MPRRKDETRRRLIDAAYESFWRLGFMRTNMDAVAARARLTKRTLYSHFRSKDDLLAAVLSHYAELAAARLAKIGAQMPAGRDGMIDSLFSQLERWASANPRWSGAGLTRLVMELADLPGHPARKLAHNAKATTEAWIAERLMQAGVRAARDCAREVMLLIEGAMILRLVHGDRRYIDAAARAAKRLVATA